MYVTPQTLARLQLGVTGLARFGNTGSHCEFNLKQPAYGMNIAGNSLPTASRNDHLTEELSTDRRSHS